MSGLIIQWGTKGQNSYDVTFHLAFPGMCSYFNYIANRTSSTGDGWHYYHSLTRTGCKILSYDEFVLWIAIGY